MKLATIWSLPAMTLKERMRRSIDWAALSAASRLPQRIQYWVVMMAIGKATKSGPFITKPVMSLTVDEILKTLEGKDG